ncbi:hypothetical protein ACFQER_04795 [Halomicroarcula sp. GCM10025894]|uniref:hypothetical protein n=1 Tax=Halomicroarcula sp. GCM10025894 TaxID=3252673 RepID=UPI00361A6BC7
MSADGSDEDEFVAEYEHATAADIIEEAEPSATAEGDDAEEDEEEGAVAGSFAPDIEVTPQRPRPRTPCSSHWGSFSRYSRSRTQSSG